MSFAAILASLLKVLDSILSFMERRKIEDGAVAKHILEAQRHAAEIKSRADHARADTPPPPAGDPRLHDDGFRRD
jgi:hypothetical protein